MTGNHMIDGISETEFDRYIDGREPDEQEPNYDVIVDDCYSWDYDYDSAPANVHPTIHEIHGTWIERLGGRAK
jgi:hypothetical protein